MIGFLMSRQKAILIAVAIILPAMPIIVWLIYYLGYRYGGLYTDITADGMLGYIIGAISSIASALVSIIAIKQSRQANTMAERANAMSERLMKLEENRYKLELRPFILVTGWSAFGKPMSEINSCNDNMHICVGSNVGSTVNCLSIKLTNTTQSFLTVQYESAFDHNSNNNWGNSSMRNPYEAIKLSAGESQEITFYADDPFFYNTISHIITFKFALQNRFSERYLESVDIIVLSYEDAFVQGLDPNGQWEVALTPQNYQIGKWIKSREGVLQLDFENA